MKKSSLLVCALVLLAVCLLILPTQAEATVIDTGKCGDNVSWSIDEKYHMTISGTGAITENTWDSYDAKIEYVTIESGITAICDYAFFNCENLTAATIPATLTTVGDYAAGWSLETIYYTGTEAQLNAITIGEVDLTYVNLYCNAAAITDQPVSVTVPAGKTATVNVAATGDGLTYKWYFKNKDAQIFTLTNTFTGNSYFVTMDDTRNGRQLYCIVTDKYGHSVMSDVVTINQSTLAITKQPVSTKAANNKSLNVSFTAAGEGLSYKWYYKDKGASAFTYTPTFTTNAYTTVMTAARNGRQIYCVVTDKYGQSVTTNTVTISMASAPKITKQPVSTKAAVNKTATVSFIASGEGLIYQWYYKEKGQTKFTLTTSFTSNTYSVPMTAARSGRQLYCVVTDKYGQTVKTNTVTISIAAAPRITKQPVSTKAPVNKTVTVSFTASGEGLTYKWYYKEKGQTKFTLTTSFTSNTYSVPMTAARSGRQIYCVVTDKYGQTVKTNTATISIAAAPKITKQPVSVKAANSKSLTVSFTASGEGLTYKWYYKNKGASAFTYTSTFKSNSYTTTMDATRNGRQLYCVVTDKYGQTIKTVTVTISMAAAPRITKQPVSVKAANSKSLTVSFTASGEGLTYKWYYKDKGASVFTYTPTFTTNAYITVMSAARNGRQIYCIVTDKYGQTVKTNTVTISMK